MILHLFHRPPFPSFKPIAAPKSRLGGRSQNVVDFDRLRSIGHARLALGLLLISVIESMALGETGSETIEECLALWESAVEDIWSYDVRIRVAHRTWTAKTGKLEDVGAYSLRHRYLRGAWRVDRLEDCPAEGMPLESWKAGADDVHAVAWDGAHVRTFVSDTNLGYIGSLPDANEGHTQGPLFHQLFGCSFLGSSYVDTIRKRTGETVSRKPGSAIVAIWAPADRRVLVDYSDRRMLVTLDPDKGYMPARIAVTMTSDSDNPHFEFENSLDKVAGRWLPVRSVKRIFRPTNGPERVELAAEQHVDVDAATALINVDIDPDVFRLPFPDRAVVYDKTIHKNFLTTPNDGRDYAGYDRWVAEVAEKRRTSSSPPPTGIVGRRAGVVAIMIAFLAATVVLLVTRMRR